MRLSLAPGMPARRDDVWVRRTSGENAVYDRRTGAVHLLNHTALAIWDLCDGQTRPDEMIAAICDASGMPPEVATEDVERTLREFERLGLITWTLPGGVAPTPNGEPAD